MKKLLLIIIGVAIALIATPTMAQGDYVPNFEVNWLLKAKFMMPATVTTETAIEQTVGETEDTYVFTNLPQSQVKEYVLTITCHPDNSGTIQFSAGSTIVAGHRASVAGEKRVITIKSGYTNLKAKGSTSGQKFTADY